MIKQDVLYLISETPSTHGVFETSSYAERMVFCAVRSVTSAEFWRAHEKGITPEYVFVLADYTEYNGEKLIVYNGNAYAVIRTYVNKQAIEIYVERANINATELTGGA